MMTVSIILWVVLTVVWAYIYVTGNVALPDAVGYETQWEFQLVFFAISRLPFLLVVLFVIVCVQYRGTPR